MFIHAVILK